MDVAKLIQLLRKKQHDKAFLLARETPALVNAPIPDEDGETPFLWALRFGDSKSSLELLALGADVSYLDNEGLTPVEVAIDGSPYATQAHVDARTEIVAALLAKGAPMGASALVRAASLGAGKARALVALLIKAGAPTGVERREGGRGDVSGAPPSWSSTEGIVVDVDDMTLLHLACTYDLPEALEAGLAAGIDPNAPVAAGSFDGGSTALHIAVKKRRDAMVARLIAAGADPERKNKRGESPMSLATAALKKVLAGGAPPPKAGPPAKKPKGPDELLAAIWAAPRDSAALGVWADWLTQSGEGSRGEYVSLCLLPKPTAEQKKRAAALLAKDRGKWLGAARKLVSEWTDSDTSPGFVAQATVNVDNLVGQFDAIRALGPELVVRVTPIKTRLLTKKLAALPLGKLYGLSFYNTEGTYSMNRDWLDDTSLGILGPSLAGLRARVLAPCIQANHGEGFTPKALAHLATAGATLEQLTLDFTGSRPEKDLLTAIQPKLFPKLRTLTIRALAAPQRKPIKAAFTGTNVEVTFEA
ncbi:MAG: ankyrin repeat domain-containing protein [Polyangiaceae bacterium]